MYRERKRERERERERGGETFILPLLNSHETVNREKCSDVAQLPKKSIESRRGFLSQHFALQYRPFYARRARALPSQNFYRERAANRNEANWIYAASLLQRNFPKKFATDRDRNEIPRQLFRTHYCASAKFSTSAPRLSLSLSLSLSVFLCSSIVHASIPCVWPRAHVGFQKQLLGAAGLTSIRLNWIRKNIQTRLVAIINRRISPNVRVSDARCEAAARLVAVSGTVSLIVSRRRRYAPLSRNF
jgi:hypothetical protein